MSWFVVVVVFLSKFLAVGGEERASSVGLGGKRRNLGSIRFFFFSNSRWSFVLLF